MNPDTLTFDWTVGDRILRRERQPLLMGILNVTPDSFSDGGRHNSADAAVAHALQLEADGADIIDIGGESTRPGAAPVSVDEELQRTVPVIEQLATRTRIPISIDTTKSRVAAAALHAGARIINDISGMTFDADMMKVAAENNAAVCLMHIQGTPQTMQNEPSYEDVVQDVTAFLKQQMSACLAAGIDRTRICLDPGIGFGKTADHNLELMKAVDLMRHQLGRPLLIGHSRKRFLSKILGRDVEERLAGTIGVSIAMAQNGTDILRVHDVRATRDALTAWDMTQADTISESGQP